MIKITDKFSRCKNGPQETPADSLTLFYLFSAAFLERTGRLSTDLSSCSGRISKQPTTTNYQSSGIYQVDPPNNFSPLCSVFDKYCASIYWSLITLTTTGYGDFHPNNVGEFIFCAVYVLVTMAITSYVLGNMTAIIVKLSSRVQDYVSACLDWIVFCFCFSEKALAVTPQTLVPAQATWIEWFRRIDAL
jgi:hypothetical protein